MLEGAEDRGAGADERPRNADGIVIHRKDDFAGMHAAGRLAAECLDMITDQVRPGVTTARLDKLIHDFVYDHGAVPATLGYEVDGKVYKYSSCISLNHVVCHGLPSEKQLRDGDILNIDVTVILDGWHGDNSRMYVAGAPNRRAERLINVAHEALMRGVEAVKPGATFSDIGQAIQVYAEGQRCSVVRKFCGHGLGLRFHDKPSVLHYRWPTPVGPDGKPESPVLEPGMFFTIEPMINLGKADTKFLADGWTAVTRDRSLSAQFEHSIGVTEDGAEIFTLSPAGLFHPFQRSD